MRAVLSFPVDRNHPPAAAVVEKLKAVDAAGKGFFTFGMPGLVTAPDMRNVVPQLNAIADRSLVETFLLQERLASLDVFLSIQHAGGYFSILVAAAGNEPRPGIKL